MEPLTIGNMIAIGAILYVWIASAFVARWLNARRFRTRRLGALGAGRSTFTVSLLHGPLILVELLCQPSWGRVCPYCMEPADECAKRCPHCTSSLLDDSLPTERDVAEGLVPKWSAPVCPPREDEL